MSGYGACSIAAHRSSDWQLELSEPGSVLVCGVCHPPADPKLAQPVALGPRAELAECEAVISRGLATFIEVGEALLQIRDERLYREAHGSFEDYCRERWDFSRPRAYQLMQAAEMSTNVDTALPSEAVARELAPLRAEPDAMREAWAEALEQHGPTPTAAQVRASVNGHRSLSPPLAGVPILDEPDDAILEAVAEAIERDGGQPTADQTRVDEHRNGRRPEPVRVAPSSGAAEIRAEHEASERDRRSAVKHAARAGELLLEANARVPAREWRAWLKRERIPERAASRYMDLASREGPLPPERCACAVPLPNGDGGCCTCGRELPA